MKNRTRHPISALELYRFRFHYRTSGLMIRIHTWISLVLLCLWFPLGMYLDESWGWENNLIENSQLVIIVLGAWASFQVSRRFEPKTKLRRFWLWSIAVWGICFARELSWGRSLFPKGPPGGRPRFHTLDELWFGPLVHPIVGLLMLVMIIGLLSNLDLKGMIRTVRIPVLCTVIVVFSAVLSSMFEQEFFPMTPGRATVFEEFGETVLWWSLLGVISANIRTPRCSSFPGS